MSKKITNPEIKCLLNEKFDLENTAHLYASLLEKLFIDPNDTLSNEDKEEIDEMIRFCDTELTSIYEQISHIKQQIKTLFIQNYEDPTKKTFISKIKIGKNSSWESVS